MIKHTEPNKISQLFPMQIAFYIIFQSIKENILGDKKSGIYCLMMSLKMEKIIFRIYYLRR